MRVLLIGEYSGFHNALKEGLIELGNEALLAAHGDGFKSFPADILWDSAGSGLWSKLNKFRRVIASVSKLKEYDVVQFINPEIFSLKFGFNERAIKHLIKNNDKSFLVVAGDDCVVWDYWKDPRIHQLKYSWIPDGIKYDFKGWNIPWSNETFVKWQHYLNSKVNGIIPIMYEYAQPYRSYPNLKNTIGIPINTSKVHYTDNIVKNKLVIFHGLNRYGVKGTKYVEEAFSILRNRYPNDLELIIDGKMPYSEYVNIVKKANVIIDQTSSYSLAVNALTSMAMGKVVLGGAEPESIQELKYNHCPVLNVTPDPIQIVKVVENLLEQKNNITQIGWDSRKFVEENHDYIKIASEYIKTWKGG